MASSTSLVAGAVQGLNRTSPSILMRRIGAHADCLEVWRTRERELDQLIKEGATQQTVAQWAYGTKLICDLLLDTLGAFVPAAGVTRAFAVTAGKDAVDIALAAIKDGAAGAVKEWTVVAVKTTTAGAFEEAARQMPSSKSLKGLSLVTGKVFTVLQSVQTIKAATDDLIGFEDSLASLRIQLQEVRTLIRDLRREYRTLIEQFEQMQAQTRVA